MKNQGGIESWGRPTIEAPTPEVQIPMQPVVAPRAVGYATGPHLICTCPPCANLLLPFDPAQSQTISEILTCVVPQRAERGDGPGDGDRPCQGLSHPCGGQHARHHHRQPGCIAAGAGEHSATFLRQMVAKILSKSKESRLDGLLWAERDAVRGRGTSRRCSRVRPAAAAPLLAPALRASSGNGCCKRMTSI